MTMKYEDNKENWRAWLPLLETAVKTVSYCRGFCMKSIQVLTKSFLNFL